MANYKGDYRLDGGGTTRPLSTQRRNCRPACRRPFPACSTTLCMWLLAVEAAAACSARVRRCSRLVDSFSLRVQLLYAERSGRVPPRVLCQRLGVRTITSGAPYACGCAACVATRCSYVRHDGVTRCKLELPSGPTDMPGRPASPLIPQPL